MDSFRLKIAIQKSGRLSNESRKLFELCGIKINLLKPKLLVFAENMPIEILFVRDDDIPGLIMDGIVDLGIIGENVLVEQFYYRIAKGENPKYYILQKLDFGECRLSIALPQNKFWTGPSCLQGKIIATSYPYLLKKYLDKFSVSFKYCLLNGSVEVATKVGLADAICDLVSTGATLEANGLYEVEVIHCSKTYLIQRNGKLSKIKQKLIKKLLIRIQGIIKARESKYIMMHAPIKKINEIIKLLPGSEYPTIFPLVGDKNKVALHLVSSETKFWKTMEKLKLLGASSILVLPIEKMME